jgi:hypothetical protein
MNFRDKAAPYITIGWHVFPLRPGTRSVFAKEDEPTSPLGGFYWGTIDASKIEEWSRRWPNANIALRTGEMGTDPNMWRSSITLPVQVRRQFASPFSLPAVPIENALLAARAAMPRHGSSDGGNFGPGLVSGSGGPIRPP